MGLPPSFFDSPPERIGHDRMHPSAQSKTNEVREVLWKEVLGGKLLIVSSKFRVKHLGKAPNSPLARVPKFDAHGVERATGRIIRDHSFGREASINERASGSPARPILLPTIQHAVKDVLFYKSIFGSEVPILLSKRDVSGAFEWNAFGAEVVEFFGSYVGDSDRTGFGDSFALPLRTTFGFVHSPSEWSIIGESVDILAAATRFENPRRDGPWELTARTYVDDVMIISPDIGLRPDITAFAVEKYITGLLGDGAINTKKLEEEGGWDTRAIMLDFLLDTTTNTLSLGAEKLEKARACLGHSRFDWGSKDVSLKDLQVLMGRLHHWSGGLPTGTSVHFGSTTSLVHKGEGGSAPGLRFRIGRRRLDSLLGRHGVPSSYL